MFILFSADGYLGCQGDLDLILGLGRSPGKRKCYPLQYSGLKNSMDYIVPGVAKSWTRLSDCHFHFSLSCIGEGNGNPLQSCCLENPRDGGVWWAAVYGVTQSRTRLKRLSSSSSSRKIYIIHGAYAIGDCSRLNR